MIDIKTAMEIGQYKITGGNKYLWKSFGPNARYMDFDSEMNKNSFSFIFDTETQVVYEANVCDYTKNNCYRIIHPDYIEQYKYEAESRNCNHLQAFDDVNFIELENDADFIEKATAIMNNMPYDERVVITIELPEDMMYTLMLKAHEQDITFNELLGQVLEEAIEVLENDVQD